MLKTERGIAMVATLLVMLLMTALMVAFTTLIMSDQRFRGIDKDRTQAFYAAHAGLEKQTADLRNLFFRNLAPNQAQLNALAANPPVIPGVTYLAQDGTNLYSMTVPAAGQTSGMIKTGPYQGLIALKTQYDMNATARTSIGGEVHLNRSLETVAIPVFQFGIFSDVDLSFFAGPQFNFGGRVHTNGNLFLSSGSNVAPGLTLQEKVTAVGEIIRQRLQNGASIDAAPAHNFVVTQAQAPNAFRPLDRTDGSVIDGVGSADNPAWTNLSITTYNGYIRTGKTGARPLNLPIITAGGSNPDLVRRPPVLSNENVVNPQLFSQRMYSQVSLRILLSDTAADITNLPGVTATQPISLEASWEPNAATRPAWYGPAAGDAAHPGLARSGGVLTAAANVRTAMAIAAGGAVNVAVTTGAPFTAIPVAISLPSTFVTTTGVTFWCRGFATLPINQLTGCNVPNAIANNVRFSTPAANDYYLTPANTPTIGGFIKIERQDQNQVWTDVTQEILAWGMSAKQQSAACLGVAADASPNAILRLQRVQANPAFTPANVCNGGAAPANPGGTDYWPLALFDPREGAFRDVAPAPANIVLGGVMYYVQLDVTNLSLWFRGAAPYAAGTGNLSRSTNGYSVYFSDRRNNRNGFGQETGEYGFEDVVNPATAAGTPNGFLDPGEDVNANQFLETYGQNPRYNGAAGVPPGSIAPLTAVARPWSPVASAWQAEANRPILFRRALKLVRGTLGAIVQPGLTIVAENPVYVEGDWNAAPGFPAGAATSVIADSVTLLSSAWYDEVSFANPYNPGARPRPANSWYRFATIAGKPSAFPQPTWGAAADFGTDGGAHNFLRMLESGGTVNYRGSIATFYYSRQATGTYKCCAIVYNAPVRNFNFDTNFLTPALLPPLTPAFRDVDTLGFSQENRPGR